MSTASGVGIDRRAALRKGALLLAGAFTVPSLGVLAACVATEPRPIAYGHDECAWCRMVVSDSRFAAALVTAKGRTLVFDSTECLASYTAQSGNDRGRDAARSLWVSDYDHPGHLLPARRARFVRIGGPGRGSPMGQGLVALRSDADARRLAKASPTLGWDEVTTIVAREGLRRGIATNVAPLAAGESR